MKKIGLIINPLAGIGGPMGLKGSDGDEIVEKALAMGAKPQAENRARTALEVLTGPERLDDGLLKDIMFYCYGGSMGENLLRELGYTCTVLGWPEGARSTGADTEAAAKAMVLEGVDIIVFAGGDGTARNVAAALNSSGLTGKTESSADRSAMNSAGLSGSSGSPADIPVIGIPAGVKIHSAVYALNPLNAGYLLKDWIEGKNQRVKEAEVMDIDEDLFRQGKVAARLYGYLNVLDSAKHMQCCKSAGPSDEDSLLGIATYVADSMEKGTYYIIGSGSTTRYIMDELELPDTLLGIDLVKDFELVAADLSEPELWKYIEDPEVKVKMVVTVIGGQGNIFGRGNQQLSPRVIRRVGRPNIMVIAGPEKIMELPEHMLRVDTGDPELDRELSGYMSVVTGYDIVNMIKVSGE